MAESGKPITGDSLNALYLGLLKKYYGHDDGVMQIDDHYAAEWAFVPHFHYNFYVYQYATSYIAATGLAEGILQDRPGAKKAFLDFLAAGKHQTPGRAVAGRGRRHDLAGADSRGDAADERDHGPDRRGPRPAAVGATRLRRASRSVPA